MLSLDVLRCVARSSGLVLQAYFTQTQVPDHCSLNARPGGTWCPPDPPPSTCVLLPPRPCWGPPPGSPPLAPAVGALEGALSALGVFVEEAAARPPSYLELAARDLAYSLARIYMGQPPHVV